MSALDTACAERERAVADAAIAKQTIQRLAEVAEAFSGAAGVGGLETAGHLVSYLADHPEHIEPLLRHGIPELPPEWVEHGSLSYHARNGKVVRPETARRARTIKQLEQSA